MGPTFGIGPCGRLSDDLPSQGMRLSIPSKGVGGPGLNLSCCIASPPSPGMKVRMGIASGTLKEGLSPASSSVLELAKLVSDAGAGGQILMCMNTFR